MRFSSFRHAAVAASLLQFVAAQNSIPSDLQGQFSNQIQVSYNGQAEEGFQDGASFGKDQVAKEPVFALGDSDGIAPANIFTIVMIDTTNDNARRLHYVRSNFKHSEGVKLESQTQALLEYKAPGTAGETGNEAQYTFLLYRNPQRNQVQSMNLPGDGEAFDVKKFQSDNGLNNPNAAIGMVVKLDGAAAESSSSSSSSLQRTSTSAAPSSTVAAESSSVTSAAPTSTTSATRAPSSNVQSAPASTAVPSSSASTSAGPRTSQQASASASAPASEPSTSGAAEQPQDQTSATARPTSNGVPTGVTPTTVSLTRAPGTSATTSDSPAQQTGNMGAMLSVPDVHAAVLAPVVVLARLFL